MRAPARGRDRRRGDASCAAATRARRSTRESRTCPRTASIPGVAPSLSIASNLVLKSYRRGSVTTGPLLRLRAIREHAVGLIERYDVRGGGPDLPGAPAVRRQPAEGRARARVRRRAARARRRLADPRPRRRLRSRRCTAISATPLRAASGCCSSREDLDEILALADRIAVIYEGAIVGERDARERDASRRSGS